MSNSNLNIVETWEDLLIDDSFIDNLFIDKNSNNHIIDNNHESIIDIKKSNKDNMIESTENKQRKIPICCVLGGVDNGKTTFLDSLRKTKVQDKEPGKITQIISGTNILKSELECYFEKFKTKKNFDISIPGVLLIDTPGHESFISLRKLGAKLCDIAIVIIDIKKGPDKETIKSLQLLQESQTPFIIALNKIDTLYKWQSTPGCPFAISKKNQSENTLNHFDKLIGQNFLQFANQGINAKLYTQVSNFREWSPMVPISARTKEGFSDLIAVLIKMSEKVLDYIDPKEVAKGIVIEKYMDLPGVGNAIDIILTDGQLKINDKLYIIGQEEAIKIKGINYHNHITNKIEKIYTVNSSFSCTLYGTNIQDVVPGSYFSTNIEKIESNIMTKEEVKLQVITDSDKGIFIQADSIGSLLALSYILKQNNIPVKKYAIGPIKTKHLLFVQQFCEPKIVLGFNVSIDNKCDNRLLQEIPIYIEKIVFKLLDRYNLFYNEYEEELRNELLVKTQSVVWPCVLTIEKGCIFRQKDPLIFAVKVKKGTLNLNTPLSTFNYKIDPNIKNKEKKEVKIGRVTSIRYTNEKDIDKAEKGEVVIIKVEGESNISFGRHLSENNMLYSRITRKSLNIMKGHLKSEIDSECLELLIKLKTIFNID